MLGDYSTIFLPFLPILYGALFGIDFSAIAGFFDLSTRVRRFGRVRRLGCFWKGKKMENRGKKMENRGKKIGNRGMKINGRHG